MGPEAYDVIGRGYAQNRRPDPRIAARLRSALGDARSVVNVGAGTGSYEPTDLEVIAVEPSAKMIAQRPPEAAEALKAAAESLPLDDDSVDAAMTVFSVHHWRDPEAGIAEMRRVARRRIVVLTFDPDSLQRWWISEYAPEIAEDDRDRFPAIERLLQWLGGGVASPVEVPADCTDLFLGALWARPELILEKSVRASTSGFARLDPATERRAVARVRADLESGEWDRRHGALRRRDHLDVGVRLIVSKLL